MFQCFLIFFFIFVLFFFVDTHSYSIFLGIALRDACLRTRKTLQTTEWEWESERKKEKLAYTAHTCQTSDKSMEKGIFIDNKKKKEKNTRKTELKQVPCYSSVNLSNTRQSNEASSSNVVLLNWPLPRLPGRFSKSHWNIQTCCVARFFQLVSKENL